MDSRIRLGVRVFIGLLLVGIAFLAARGFGNIIAERVIRATPYATGPSEAFDASKLGKTSDDNADLLIYNRNLFNQKAMQEAEAVPDTAPAPVNADTHETVAIDGTRPMLTDIRVRLMGTQVSVPSAYSIALFMPLDGPDLRMLYLQEGASLLDEVKIAKIVRNRVYFYRITHGNRLEYIDITTTEEDLAEAKKNLEKVRVAERPAPSDSPSPDAITIDADTITRVGTDTFQVPRDTVEAIRRNPNVLKDPKYGAIPKIQPIYRNGVINGFRVLGVESDSLYAQLGIRSGDTILDINGQQVDNPQKAMALFDNLGPDQDVGIKINRAGQEKTLTFQLK